MRDITKETSPEYAAKIKCEQTWKSKIWGTQTVFRNKEIETWLRKCLVNEVALHD